MNSVLPSRADKPRYVAEMFGRIAWRYDLMNTLMTGGLDRGWRRAVADLAVGRASSDSRVLDVGTGTGQLLLALQAAAPESVVTGVDFSLPMLRAAPSSLLLAGADGLQLPFASDTFDAVVSGFVVRNLADSEAGLAEQVRVLRPGGRLVILETTPGPGGLLRPLYRLYFRSVVPRLGQVIAGDPSAYSYLPESTLAFVEPSHLAAVLRALGLLDVQVQRLALGTVGLTSGRKPSEPT